MTDNNRSQSQGNQSSQQQANKSQQQNKQGSQSGGAAQRNNLNQN